MKNFFTNTFLAWLLLLPIALFGQLDERLDSVSVLFPYRKAEPLSSSNLKKVVEKHRETVTKIVLIGYTDTLGKTSDNSVLASKRMQSVIALLGLDQQTEIVLDTLNYNETQGVQLPEIALNRRVDVILYAVKPLVVEKPQEIELGKPMNLQVNFENANAVFLPESYHNLELLYSIMKKDSTLIVDLQGHVCCTDNYTISMQRADAVRMYLLRKGIAANRMTVEGFSNRRRLVPDDSPENMSINRRVEAVFRR